MTRPDIDAQPAVQVAQPAAQVAIDLAALRVSEGLGAVREHFGALFEQSEIRSRERFESHLREHGQLDGLWKRLMAECDKRYDERYQASQIAVQAAFVAQEKAIAAALAAAEKLNSSSLVSAERAVLKAEMASEKRFASVNEFRQTLSDQAASLITRTEVQARLEALAEKIDAGLDVAGKETSATLSRLDRMDGKSGGVDWLARALAGGLGLLIAVVSVLAQR